MIKPRLVFGGHTHHGCHIKHTNGVDEYSVSSFSWRNKYNPSYMLVSFIINNKQLIFITMNNSKYLLSGYIH